MCQYSQALFNLSLCRIALADNRLLLREKGFGLSIIENSVDRAIDPLFTDWTRSTELLSPQAYPQLLDLPGDVAHVRCRLPPGWQRVNELVVRVLHGVHSLHALPVRLDRVGQPVEASTDRGQIADEIR